MSNHVNDAFKETLRDWLVNQGWSGNFYHSDEGWFIMDGAKKVILPKFFQDHSELLGII